MKNTTNKKMFISAFMATICLVLIVAAVFSYTFVEQGYAYWYDDSSDGNVEPVASEDVDVIAPGKSREDLYFDNSYTSSNTKYTFNPSAKYFKYQIMNGTTVLATCDAVNTPTSVDLTSDGGIVLNPTETVTGATSIAIVGYNGNLPSIEIPRALKVEGIENPLPVTSVSGINSTNSVALTHIVIPNTVTTIGANCFSGYRATLKEIRFEARESGQYSLAAQAFRFSKGASTTVYYGEEIFETRAEINTHAGFSLAASTTFLGWTETPSSNG